MRKILVLGGGKIGSLIAVLFTETGEYEVHLGDVDKETTQRLANEIVSANFHTHVVDVMAKKSLDDFLAEIKVDGIVSSLPYFCNPTVGEVARAHDLHYFDLTEDVEVTEQIKTVSQDARQAFVPQCGARAWVH